VFKTDLFELPEALLGEMPRLSGLDGQKMSKSRNNAIYLKDSKEDVSKKVMKVFTDPTRIHASDPGHIEGNVLFEYFDAFNKDKEEVKKLKEEYKKGKVGDVSLKKRLGEVINEFLEPIRERRKEYESKPKLIEKILEEGIEKTRKEAKETMKMVKEAIYK
jgi:tryptophanyl-tRNA synthetase